MVLSPILQRCCLVLYVVLAATACSGDTEYSDITQVVDYVVACDSAHVGPSCLGPTSVWATYPHTVIISTNEVRALGEGRGIGSLVSCNVTTPYEWTCLTEHGQAVSRKGLATYGLYPEGTAVVSKLEYCLSGPRPGEKSTLEGKLWCLALR
jgi:hypothetical protein